MVPVLARASVAGVYGHGLAWVRAVVRTPAVHAIDGRRKIDVELAAKIRQFQSHVSPYTAQLLIHLLLPSREEPSDGGANRVPRGPGILLNEARE